jgi:hypothetical protein
MWCSWLASTPETLETWQRERQQTVPFTNQRLAAIGDLVCDSYAIGSEALDFLDRRIMKERPRAILEFGSGMSTVGLASCMASLRGAAESPRVFSIDESAAYIERTRQLLDLAGLSSHVRLAHRPLRQQTILDRSTLCYDIDSAFLESFLPVEPDFVLVDGPSGGGDVRYGTLPLVATRLARPCRLFLDDALRAGELRVVSLWRRMPAFHAEGIHLVGEGSPRGFWG